MGTKKQREKTSQELNENPLMCGNFIMKEKKVEKWLKHQGQMVPSEASSSNKLKSEQDPSTWPPSTATPFYSKCRCGWSEASTRGTACCQHKGSCQHCIDNLADVATEVDNFSEGLPRNFEEDVDTKLSKEPPDDIKIMEIWMFI